jgi:cold shock CspA family protein
MSLVTGQAWFRDGADGLPVPCPARMQIWRQDENGKWGATTIEDPDSNVFHKIVPMDDGSLVTIGAMGAVLKQWRFTNGAWSQETLWEKSWGGRFDRIRDIEIGDVDGDGKDEWVLATHDQGVVAVYNPEDGAAGVIEMDQKADTFVHEIEIGDIDGDGKLEFFATPSDRNKVGHSQKGSIVMYKFDGTQYVRSVVEAKEGTHAKEILVTDLDGDGKDELLGVFEAELGENREILTPVQIRQYDLQPDGSFKSTVLAEIQDEMCRFLVAGDLDGDGAVEMVAAAKNSGLWVLENAGDGTWTPTNIDSDSSGFEHVAKMADLDGDGQVELYVAADDQRTLSRYEWNAETSSYDKTTLAVLPSGFTWNLEAGKL